MRTDRLEHILKHDFSAGTERFREDLLRRCIDLIRTGDGHIVKQRFQESGSENDRDACQELPDDELDMLAAAGIVELPPQDSLND